ncbi:MAG: DNA polymerase III subunit beta [Okeania sp. SIO2H7]|nr:DNA polymerase III subunit beta [Okeania sp. SIO2H7]
MKFLVEQKNLSKTLSEVYGAISPKPTHPILANVLLVADEGNQEIKLTSFDLSLGICSSLAAIVEVGGGLTLPAKLLKDIISRLPDGEITIEGDKDTAIATILSGFGKYEVWGMAANEYPDLPNTDGENVRLSSESILDGLRGTLFAASNDITKQVLTGVHLKIQPDTLEFAATDGYRLAIVKTERIKSEIKETETGEIEVTIPAKALQEVERAIAHNCDSKYPLDLIFNKEQVIFKLETQRLTSRVLEGKYPDYPQFLPNNFTNQFTINRKNFLSAVERIAILAAKNTVKCNINYKNQEISLSVDAQDVGSGKETLPAQIISDGLGIIAFNTKYLIDGLKAVLSTEIQLLLNTPSSPVILKALGGVEMVYLIMPIQLKM